MKSNAKSVWWLLLEFESIGCVDFSGILIEIATVQKAKIASAAHPYIQRKLATMFKLVPTLLRSQFSVHQKFFQIKSVIFLLCLNACLKISVVIAGPTIQQEQELLLLEALSKRQPSYYGTSNSLMDILGRSMYSSAILFRSTWIKYLLIIRFD